MTRERLRLSWQITGLALVLLSTGVWSGCGKEEPVSPGSTEAGIEQDPEARQLVQRIRDGLAKGERPPVAVSQRLKEIGSRYPEDLFVEQTLLSVLPPMKDWDGLVKYLELKRSLTAENRLTLTKVYLRQGDYESALRTGRPLADRDPSAVEINAYVARAMYLLGDQESAIEYYDRVFSLIIERGMMSEVANRAMISFDAGRVDEALDTLRGQLTDYPDSGHLHYALSRVLAANGEPEEAGYHGEVFAKIQAEISRAETSAMLQAAQTLALNEAWEERDLEMCQLLIYEFLPSAQESFREDLYQFLGRMYEAAGRGAEAATVIQRARQHARTGGE